MSKPTIECEYDEVSGKLTLDLVDFLGRLDDETKRAVARDSVYASAAFDELKRALTHDYASETFDGTIHALRVKLLTGEGAPEMTAECVRGLLSDLAQARADTRVHRDAFWKLAHLWSEAFDQFAPVRVEHQYKGAFIQQAEEYIAEFAAKWPEKQAEAEGVAA